MGMVGQVASPRSCGGPNADDTRLPGEENAGRDRRRHPSLGVRKAYSGHVAVEGLSLDGPARQRLRPAGTERRGQDHHAAHGDEHPRPGRGHDRDPGRAGRPRRPRPRRLHAGGARPLPAHGAGGAAPLLGRDQGHAARRGGRRLPAWLERMGLAEWAQRKVNELSKGMQQKAQFVATLLHEPEVLILDEPHERPRPGGRRPGARRAARAAPPGQDAGPVQPPDGDGRAAVRLDRAHQPRATSCWRARSAR